MFLNSKFDKIQPCPQPFRQIDATKKIPAAAAQKKTSFLSHHYSRSFPPTPAHKTARDAAQVAEEISYDGSGAGRSLLSLICNRPTTVISHQRHQLFPHKVGGRSEDAGGVQCISNPLARLAVFALLFVYQFCKEKDDVDEMWTKSNERIKKAKNLFIFLI